MWRLTGFHLLLLSDKFHLNFCFPDPPKKVFKKTPRTLHYYVGIYMNEFFLLKHYGQYLITRASDRSRKKKSNFVGFLGTNSRKNWPISQEFHGSFQGKLHQKAIDKKRPILWLFSRQISLEIDRFCADQTSLFNVFLTEVIICSFNNNTLQK